VGSAPGRVNLIGEHTDYNGGDVLPMALDLRTWVAVDWAEGSRSRAVSTGERAAGEFDASAPLRCEQWWDYIAGVVRELRLPGIAGRQLDFAVASSVPSGAGLSSSAALEVATAGALASLAGAACVPLHLAKAAHRAETAFVGVACGIMDQFASALGQAGHAVFLACDSEAYELVPMTEPVLVVDSGVPRALRASAYNTRRAECDAALAALRRVDASVQHLARAPLALLDRADLPPVLLRRARHVVSETARVRDVVDATRQGAEVPGAVLLASHASLRDDYECSTPELDWLVAKAAGTPGIRGARLTGAGWGGCILAVGDRPALMQFAGDALPEYHRVFGHHPRSWLSSAADGVRIH
jgi:galactokinase